ncbi:MAG: hypothetical protein ABT940_01725 [Alphaproteobacteria bacterium]
MNDTTEVYAIGDSHALFWTGRNVNFPGRDYIPGIATCSIFGALAWKLVEDESTSRGRERALAAIDLALGNGFRGWFLLCFGEIDIRCHVARHARVLGLRRAAEACAERYVRFIREVRERYARVAVWAPIASTNNDPKYPPILAYGTTPERNFLTVLFTDYLGRKLAADRVPVISILPYMIGKGGHTRQDFLHDTHHLSVTCLPIAISLLRERLSVEIESDIHSRDFFEGYVSQSAQYDVVQLANFENVHLLRCDLGSITYVTSVVISGPAVYGGDKTLLVLVSSDGENVFVCNAGNSIDLGLTRKCEVQVNAYLRYVYVSLPLDSSQRDLTALYDVIGVRSFLGKREIYDDLSVAECFSMANESIETGSLSVESMFGHLRNRPF